jgi:replicative DNA helicase
VELSDSSTQSIKQTVASHLEQIEQRRNGTFQCTATGLVDLDEVLGGGLQNGGLYLVAGRPALGKTALSLNVALNMLRSQRPVVIFAPQMEHLEIARRFVGLEGALQIHSPGPRNLGIEYDENLDESHWGTFTEAAHRVASFPLISNNDDRITPAKVRAISEEVRQSRGDLGLVILDSFEAMATAANVRGNKLEGLMADMKQIAVDLTVPVIVCSLLHRSIEARSDKRPMLTDVTPRIEAPADVALLLYRDQVYYQDSLDHGTIEIFMAKNRWGKRGVVRMDFSDDNGIISSTSER